MQFLRINPLISVAGQISEQDVADIAAQGFKTVINNRPDQEGGTPSAQIAAACKRHGMAFFSQPVTYAGLNLEHGDEFAQVLAKSALPALVYCRSGRRSAALWAIASAPLAGADVVLDKARPTQTGIDDLRPLIVLSAQRASVPYADLSDPAAKAKLAARWVDGATTADVGTR